MSREAVICERSSRGGDPHHSSYLGVGQLSINPQRLLQPPLRNPRGNCACDDVSSSLENKHSNDPALISKITKL